MNLVLYGATGMVGQAVLRECLLDPEVTRVLTIGRSATGQQHEKLHELVQTDLFDYSSLDAQLQGYDACLFCLGVSSSGMSEKAYTRITYDLTLAAASALSKHNPVLTFVFVSGAGTDSSESGRVMWARIKGKAENALLRMPFRGAYVFRPAFIQPVHGVVSRTQLYRVFYAFLGPLYPLLRRLFPKYVTTSEHVARAMLRVAKHGASKRVLENADIEELGSA